MEPILDLIVQSAIGAGTNQAVEGIASLGKSVIPVLWSHLRTKGRNQVEVNLKNFGSQFVAEVQRLIDSGQLSKDQLDAVLNQPDAVDLLIQSLTHAAQTDSAEKQVLLAKIVAERLMAETDSELVLASRMACNAISKLNVGHLNLLALCYIFANQSYEGSEGASEGSQRLREVEWVIRTFEPYQDIVGSRHDVEHLEAVGCVGGPKGWPVGDLSSTLKRMVSSDLDLETLMNTATGQRLEAIWNSASIYGLVLTSVGSLIGMYTSDILTHRQTDLAQWLQRSPS